MTNEEFDIQKNKILEGLELAYKNLIQFKKDKKSPLVIMKNNKIVKINPNRLFTNYSK
jgi:hypothetical protein